MLSLFLTLALGQNLVVPGSGNPPNMTTLCQNYSIYLQSPPGATTPSILWRCIRRHWMQELAPQVDRMIVTTSGQTTVIVSKPKYVPASLQVFRNGLLQDSTDYSTIGTTVVFKSSLSIGDKIALSYLWI